MKTNIESKTLRNNNYRKVVYTIPDSMQLVVMSLKSREEIGMEVHQHTSQFIRVESGKAIVIISGKKYRLKSGDVVIVPMGKKHNIINSSYYEPLKLYTIYTPPEHPKKLIQKLKPKD